MYNKTLTFWSSSKSTSYNDNLDRNNISSLKQLEEKKFLIPCFAKGKVTAQRHAGDCSSGTTVIIEIRICDQTSATAVFYLHR